MEYDELMELNKLEVIYFCYYWLIKLLFVGITFQNMECIMIYIMNIINNVISIGWVLSHFIEYYMNNLMQLHQLFNFTNFIII